MPDITMCKGTGCELKDKCYRHNAKPTPHWQSYFVTPPIKDGQCRNFWLDDEEKEEGASHPAVREK